jgi:hypothetical protein
MTTTTHVPARWQLIADMLGSEIGARVDVRPYPGGTSYSITLRRPGGGLVEVHDKWWSRNPDVWTGYEVHIEDADSIVTKTWPRTKSRREVVAAVEDALR